MDSLEEKQEILPLLKWVPAGIGLSLCLLLISTWRIGVVTYWFAMAVGVGLLYGFILIGGFLKNAFGLALAGGMIVVKIGEDVARYLVFDILDGRPHWWVRAQFFTTVWLFSLGLIWTLRHRLHDSLSQHNPEHVVGPERR